MSNEEILEEEETTIAPWIERQESLSSDEKLNILKDLAHYAESEEYKELERTFAKNIKSITEEIKEKAYTREEAKVTKSNLDKYVVIAKATREIADSTTNANFANYLINSRVESLDSAIVNKVGNVYTEGGEAPFDMPIYTDLDMMKTQVSVYYSVRAFLNYCIGIYDEKGKLEKIKEGEKPLEDHKVY